MKSKSEILIGEIKSTTPINSKKWAFFKIEELFDISNGKGITKNELREFSNEAIPCIQGGEFNNGILGYFPKEFKENKDYCYIDEMCISLARVGSVGAVNFQEGGCFIGDKAKALVLRKEYKNYKNKFVYLFLMTLLKRFKTSNYSEGIRTEEYLQNKVSLPVDKENQIDFEFMKKYTQELYKKILEINSIKTNLFEIKNESGINLKDWKEFKLCGERGVFELTNSISKIHNKNIKGDSGEIPYVTRTENNNGVARYITKQKIKINEGNCLSIGMDAVTIFYQEKDFYTGDKIKILRNKNFNKKNSLFLISIIKNIIKQNFHWGGRGLNFKELNKLTIKLPSKDNEPDWDYMEEYVDRIYEKIEPILK